MKKNEPRVMKELHEIREKNYEKTKHMTFKELAKSINEKAEKVMKEYRFDKKSQSIKKHAKLY